MSQTSPNPAEQTANNRRGTNHRDNATKHQRVTRHWWQGLNFGAKAVALAIALLTLAVLSSRTTAYYFTSQSITEQSTEANLPRASVSEDTASVPQRQMPLILLIETSVAALLLLSLIAAYLANRANRPIKSTAAKAKTVKGKFDSLTQSSTQTTFNLDEQAAVAERTQLVTEITLRIRQCIQLEDLLKTAVKEVRQAIKTERVIIYGLDPNNWSGTVVAESVAQGLPQTLRIKIDDPCFRDRHVEMYKNGRVRAINNIYQEPGLTDCHIKLLEQFAVKANLVAPILKNNQLLGLMIAHHCSAPRNWQKHDIDLFAELAKQVGLAIDQASFLEQQAAVADRTQLLTEITLRIRQSLHLEDLLKTAVKEVRRAIKTERVIIYGLNPNTWDGSVIAESVAQGLPQTLRVKIDDPCFRDRHVEMYKNGHVRAINNIYQEPGLADCHIKLLEQFAVKANLVAPILKNNQLLGLMIAHHCSEPRNWQQHDIDLFVQLAKQVGFSLEQASLLEQMEAPIQTAAIDEPSVAERTQLVTEITLRIRQSLNLEELFRTAVKEVRRVIKTERVIIYGLDPNTWDGSVIAESVAQGLPQILRVKIDHPCFRKDFVVYDNENVRAIDNIYQQPGLTDDYIKFLEQFGVKAKLVAPIFKNNQLLGLMIAHHCAAPRNWQKHDIDLFSELAKQVGLAIAQASFLEQQEAEAERTQLLTEITLRIRQSLQLEDLLKTAVKEVRRAIKTDRVIIYGLNPNSWDGSVIAESVDQGLPQTLRLKIDDPCFRDRHVEMYKNGHVRAIDNIYQEPGLADCHIKLLEQFAVKANLVAPILKNNQLLGLMIAHQCSEPRNWQKHDIDLFVQLAKQVGFSLDQASLLEQMEQEPAR